ncbi:hypothetical protein V1525DRAFT_58910 [Lipomyces kononenkoae]|uniref:Uncharacterized protein n=1 Tax=Lipomyces kononenkoae TaxID=34357 RepID=A0ACC3SS71_LIPKO
MAPTMGESIIKSASNLNFRRLIIIDRFTTSYMQFLVLHQSSQVTGVMTFRQSNNAVKNFWRCLNYLNYFGTIDDYQTRLRAPHMVSFPALFMGKPINEDSKSNDPTEDKSKRHSECLCGMMHRFSECPYLNESVRSKEWLADPDVKKQVDERLGNSTKLGASV